MAFADNGIIGFFCLAPSLERARIPFGRPDDRRDFNGHERCDNHCPQCALSRCAIGSGRDDRRINDDRNPDILCHRLAADYRCYGHYAACQQFSGMGSMHKTGPARHGRHLGINAGCGIGHGDHGRCRLAQMPGLSPLCNMSVL